jgi:hypothetical protein
LKKAVLYALVVRLNLDNCFRCGEKIETADVLSLDHKLDWLHVDVNLFWDLNNIAFSHRRCNKSKTHRNNVRNAPKGQSWCSGCRGFKVITEFHVDRARWNKLAAECKTCRWKYRI